MMKRTWKLQVVDVYVVSHRISTFSCLVLCQMSDVTLFLRVTDSQAESHLRHGFDDSRSALFRVVTRRALSHGCFTANATKCVPVSGQLA